MLIMARPDYIQVDSKGHPGVSSYPTMVGQRALSYDKDPMRLIRKVTEKHNVALYAHYSGAIDENYVKKNPSEARVRPDGEPDHKLISFYGKYVDSLLIPQIRELATEYKLDGVWVDGECWAIEPDYRPKAIEEFKRKYGVDHIPLKHDDPEYKKLLEFTRGKFYEYLQYYSGAIHQTNPDFQICSNWAFSAMMPEPIPPGLQLDFLSGDYNPDRALHSANWYGRSLSGQGKPFDLMAWSFVHPNTPKTAVQLCQEASIVISLGGSCQVYFRQNADLSFQPSSFRVMKEVADFVLKRKPFCQGVSILPQVALFYSTEGWKKQVDEVFKPVGFDDIRGVMDALLDGQESVEVLKTYQLEKHLNDYPVVIIPNWDTLEVSIVDQLKHYVFNGGRLLIVGPSSAKYFHDILGVKQSGQTVEISQPIGFGGRFANVTGRFSKVECLPETKKMAYLYSTTDDRFPGDIAATTRRYGKGAVGAIYAELGATYSKTTSGVIRNLINAVIADLSPDLKVSVEGSEKVHVVATQKNGKLLIQLVNTSGDHSNMQVQGVEIIPLISDLQISVITGTKPRSVIMQPDGIPLTFNFKNEETKVDLKELKIHQVIEISMN